MTGPDRNPDLDPDAGLGDERPASVEDQAATSLEVAEDLVEVVEEVLERLVAVERARPTPTPGEKRSDFRFELYPAVESEKDRLRQLKQVRAAWERLDAWVDWLVATYRLTSIVPACWPEHPAVFEELVGLRVAWVGAWADAASHEGVVIWHERLAKAKSRLGDGNWGVPRCPGTHDGSGIDLAQQHTAWASTDARNPALIAARDRALGLVRRGHGDNPVPAPAGGGESR